MTSTRAQPVGIVLAGGASTRLGRPKARATLGGRPMIERPLAALRAVVGDELAVVAKVDTPLPDLGGVAIWHEPDAPRHPFAGIVAALARAEGRPVLVCALDLPFVDADAIRRLADVPRARVVVAAGPDGRMQPLVGRYGPTALGALTEAAQAGRPARSAVRRLRPRIVALQDPWALHNVNTVEDLAGAEARLGELDQPNVKS